MLSLDDIIGMCECSDEEIQAIAMHEHVPDAIASEMAAYLVNSPDGVPKIRRFIIEDIEEAKSKGHEEQAARLNEVLKHFIATHPDYKARMNQ